MRSAQSIISELRTKDLTYREISEITGIQTTRVFRIVTDPKKLKYQEIVALERCGLIAGSGRYVRSEEFINDDDMNTIRAALEFYSAFNESKLGKDTVDVWERLKRLSQRQFKECKI